MKYVGMLVFLALVLINCTHQEPGSLYKANKSYNPDPVIDSIVPKTAIAGVSDITIYGKNFSEDNKKNCVYFKSTLIEPISSTPTELYVHVPDVKGDSVLVRVSTIGALNFSNSVYYRIDPAFIEYGNFGKNDNIKRIACDKNEVVYVLNGKSLVRVNTDQVQDTLCTISASVVSDMKIGGDYIYYVRKNNYLYKVSLNSGEEEKFVKAPIKIYSIAFGEDNIIYLGGRKSALVSMDLDTKEFVELYDYSDFYFFAMTVYEGYLYLVGLDYSSREYKIIKNKIIDKTTLGESELVLNWTQLVGNTDVTITDILFDGEGNLLISTDSEEAGMFVLSKDGIVNPLYGGLIPSAIIDMAPGNDKFLYGIKKTGADEEQRVLRIILPVGNAPIYGRYQ